MWPNIPKFTFYDEKSSALPTVNTSRNKQEITLTNILQNVVNIV